jgi:hypothetical protein
MANSALAKRGKLAAECVKQPRRPSFWLEAEGRYICPKGLEARAEAADRIAHTAVSESTRIDPRFKLVFLTVAIGTLLFTLICVHWSSLQLENFRQHDKSYFKASSPWRRWGFGALGGLLGGKVV